MHAVLSAAAVLSGLSSAALWLWSAIVPVPNVPIVFLSYVGGGGTNPEIERLTAALRKQSKLNAAAAALAAISISLQALA